MAEPGLPDPDATEVTDVSPVAASGGPPETPPAGRSAWIWASALVAVALVTALVVFLLATRSAPAPVATTPTPQPNASPSATVTPVLAPTPSPTVTPTPQPTTTPTAVPTPTPAPTPAPIANTPAQQAALLFPESGTACGATGNYSSCPVTGQLIADANAWRTNHNPSSPEPLCRCPAAYATPGYAQDDLLLPPGYQGQADKAAVKVHLWFTAPHDENMIVLFTRGSDGTWLAFGTYCNDWHNSLGAAGATNCIS